MATCNKTFEPHLARGLGAGAVGERQEEAGEGEVSPWSEPSDRGL